MRTDDIIDKGKQRRSRYAKTPRLDGNRHLERIKRKREKKAIDHSCGEWNNTPLDGIEL